jgi:outer membrane protein TolC
VVGATPSNTALSAYVLNVSQTLWNGYPGGLAQAAMEKSRLALKGKEIAAESGRLGLIFKAKQAYYTMLAAQRTISLRKEVLGKQRSLLAQISAVYDLRQASLADLKTAQVNARSAEIDWKSAEHDLRLARVKLGIIMGRSTSEEFTVAEVEDPEMKAMSLEEAVADGLGRRADITQVELSRKSNAIDLALIRGQTTPSVTVYGGGAYLVNITPGNGKTAWAWGLSAKVAMPILDADLAKHQQEEKAGLDSVYVSQEEQLRQSIAADIQDAYEMVGIAKERLAVAKLAAESTDLQLEVVRTQNQYGTATTQDLLTAAVNAANASNTLATASSGYQLAVLQLQYVMGY